MDMGLEVADFLRKGVDLVASASGGVLGNDRRDISSIVSHGYRSYREYSNPQLSLLEFEMTHRVLNRQNPEVFRQNIAFVPWERRSFSKGRHLQVMVAFADQHQIPYPNESFPSVLARRFVDSVLFASNEKNRQITIPEQLDIALRLCPDSIVGASVIAHAGSRAIAKNSDTRISSALVFTENQIEAWRDSVSTFRELTGDYGGPPADTYHFWGTFTAGLVSTIAIHKKDFVLNPVYQLLYTNMAEITDFLRYKIVGKGDGTSHKQVDVLGYHLGSYVADHLYQ